MAPARIQSCLHDEVGSLVNGVARRVDEVVEAAACTRSVDKSVAGRRRGSRSQRSRAHGGKASAADGGLRALDGKPQGKLSAEVFHHAEGVLPGPGEADHILRINLLRERFPAVLDAFLVLGCEGPHLAAGKAPSIFKCGLCINLPLAEHVTIALAVVGSHACTQKITFVVAGQLGAADLALGQQGQAALAGRKVALRHMRQVISGVRNSGERGIDVGTGGSLTRHGFRCHESARSKCDPFEVNRGGTLERIFDVLLSFLQGQHGGAGVLLEIVNIAAQGGDGLFLLAGFGSGAVSLGLSLRSRRLALIEALLQLLH